MLEVVHVPVPITDHLWRAETGLGETLKATCPAKLFDPERAPWPMRTFQEFTVVGVSLSEAKEIEDGDLVVLPREEQTAARIRRGDRVRPWRVVGRDEPSHDERDPFAGLVLLRITPGVVPFDDTEPYGLGGRRLKPGREKWLPPRWRPENAEAFDRETRPAGATARR